jgi:hypothetical protein
MKGLFGIFMSMVLFGEKLGTSDFIFILRVLSRWDTISTFIRSSLAYLFSFAHTGNKAFRRSTYEIVRWGNRSRRKIARTSLLQNPEFSMLWLRNCLICFSVSPPDLLSSIIVNAFSRWRLLSDSRFKSLR